MIREVSGCKHATAEKSEGHLMKNHFGNISPNLPSSGPMINHKHHMYTKGRYSTYRVFINCMKRFGKLTFFKVCFCEKNNVILVYNEMGIVFVKNIMARHSFETKTIFVLLKVQ